MEYALKALWNSSIKQINSLESNVCWIEMKSFVERPRQIKFCSQYEL